MFNELTSIHIRKQNAAISNKSAILRNISGYAGGPDVNEDAADYVATRFQKAVRLA